MQQKLHIVQVLPALQSGGVERGTLEVADYLVQQGHQSTVISAGGRLVTALEAGGSQHIQMPIGQKSLWTLRLIPALRRFLRDNQVDILHVRSRFPAWVCFLAWKTMDPTTRPKLITTVHGTYSVNAYSNIMTKGEQIIVISNMIREYVLNNYRVSAEKLTLNYRGVSDQAHPYGYRPDAQWLQRWYDAHPETDQKQLICLPARLTRWKGQRDFIEIIAQLKQSHPNVHGLIVGDVQKGKTAFLEELKRYAAQLGISDNISFTGHRSDIREVMAVSDIVMSLSLQPEAFGRTAIEALSLGVPVIAYSHGGVAEQMSAVLPSGLVAVGDTQQAAELALSWLKIPPSVPTKHPFSLSNMLDNTLKVYRKALNQQALS
ncbi:glycosyltransferase family 4 protein [Methylophaga thiooxydans]|uniref:Glycosyl transferase, group 1 family protein n=1 Tax=Methylophaga thiooxydans DMS010 TaxID=637616 RepID=C0N603_9GAMM|nr:glycosyltransferase family 4 protein [Methylophaga thiooxydans]EEF79989.1 glycosyl transferase, group 1 family protein [Methylophaga thiooxydans DMS010]